MKKIGCIFFVIIIVIGGGTILFLINKYNSSISYSAHSDEKILITVDKGESPSSVRDKLVNAGVIKDEEIIFGFTAYKIYAYATKFDTKIQAGSYQLTKGSSIKDIAQILQKADTEDIKVTIKEGLRLEEVADEFSRVLNAGTNKKAKFNKTDFISLAKNYTAPRDFLTSRPAGNNSIEGYLFPDTYFITSEASAPDIINLMLDNFATKIYNPNLGAIKNNKYTIHQLLTVASIVQREVQTPADMALVSDIFFRRLANKDNLGADITVLYALGYSDKEGVWWRKQEISAIDLEVNSPYNTRKFIGLPPGPIDSPGIDSFNAVLTPKANNYYYYLSDSDGITRYAKTYAEHVANQRKYL